ncbi:lytic transglycosylase domain-containing protein [Mesorhizobium sp. CC13]|uniref:lytic transglycosylase domain-containing protein n=1 Tax=Mesorhizobium sp. CC13 TaxID=3029194 RepID=UPI003264EB54
MPSFKTHLLISAALSVALLSGCQTNTAALSTDLATGTEVALATQADAAASTEAGAMASAEADIALPETVAVVPTSYAGGEVSPATAVLAAATETQAAAAAGPAEVAQAQVPAAAPAAPEHPSDASANATVAAAAATAPATPAAAKLPADAKPSEAAFAAPMAGGEIVADAQAKLVGEFPPAPALPGQILPATAPIPGSYQVASLGDVAPGSFATSSYAAPDTPSAASSSMVDALIAKYAAVYELPEQLVRRVVRRESNFRPMARKGPYWGLMQIRHDTARGMGYDGPPSGLLDAETNLKYAVKYLRGAFLVADGNEDQADRLYQRGYYYDAKRKGLLDETGLGRDRVRRRAETAL